MMRPLDESFDLRGSIAAAPALAPARRALCGVLPAGTRLRLVRSVANGPAAPARSGICDYLPALLDRTQAEVIGHG
jgi:hypothetical protein